MRKWKPQENNEMIIFLTQVDNLDTPHDEWEKEKKLLIWTLFVPLYLAVKLVCVAVIDNIQSID